MKKHFVCILAAVMLIMIGCQKLDNTAVILGQGWNEVDFSSAVDGGESLFEPADTPEATFAWKLGRPFWGLDVEYPTTGIQDAEHWVDAVFWLLGEYGYQGKTLVDYCLADAPNNAEKVPYEDFKACLVDYFPGIAEPDDLLKGSSRYEANTNMMINNGPHEFPALGGCFMISVEKIDPNQLVVTIGIVDDSTLPSDLSGWTKHDLLERCNYIQQSITVEMHDGWWRYLNAESNAVINKAEA